ncbi:competence type IV pilus major pilin ComGC [Aquibacillus saliphilus]|uniref:competence type IV pilus major pilin ComGC n=1 Tax=Aquibacillus saliphilus TaxID=1909422 RepID=UPI001CF02A04|nr:prepilin-type N-terminal cleavage/methylation domain-containing protein [Aquibacillus saliphilus]
MMKKAFKKLNNAKGFTLVELLAVIVILGIIVAIAVPAIGNIIDNAETKADEAQVELILDAARLADANDDFGDNDTDSEMSVSELVSNGYLTENATSTSDNELPKGTVKKNTNGSFTFKKD